MSGFPVPGGGASLVPTSKSAAYNASSGDLVLMSGSFATTLPANKAGQSVGVIAISGVPTVAPSGGSSILGPAINTSTSLSLSGSAQSFVILSDDGTNWHVVASSPNIGQQAAVTFAGQIHTNAGSDTSGIVSGISTTTPSSGVGFVPLVTSDCMLYVPIAATTTGTVTITFGPSTGSENTPVPSSALVASSEPTFTLRVPKGWTVIITKTGTTVAIGTCTIQTC